MSYRHSARPAVEESVLRLTKCPAGWPAYALDGTPEDRVRCMVSICRGCRPPATPKPDGFEWHVDPCEVY